VGPHAEALIRYYQDCVARWSDERYALDKRFVQLTLLLDQGEDAQGLRWQRMSETFHDLGEVLARVPESAVVVNVSDTAGTIGLLKLHAEHDGYPLTDENREPHRELAREGLMVVGHDFLKGREAFYRLTKLGWKLAEVLERDPLIGPSPSESASHRP